MKSPYVPVAIAAVKAAEELILDHYQGEFTVSIKADLTPVTEIDIMLEGSVKFWDIAAAKVIVEEAGGVMTQLDGEPISYQSTTALATNGRLHAQVVAGMKA